MRVIALLIAAVLSGCAQENYSIGDISKGSVETKRSGGQEPAFSKSFDDGRLREKSGWSAKVAGIPDEPVLADRPQRQQLMHSLQNKKVRLTSIDGLNVKQFAKLFFNDLLNVQVSLDPTLETNKGKIFLLASDEVTGAAAVELAQAALQPLSIAVSYEKNGFALKPIDAMLADTAPTIVNRSDSETPDDLKPVVQFVALTSIDPNLAHQLLQSVVTKRVKVAALQSANSVVISGPGADVSAAVSAVRTIDVPRYAGSKVATINPTYISAKAFASGLDRVLRGEGYTVATMDGSAGAIKIVAVETINAVVVFAQSDKLLNRALYWGQQLDKPADSGDEVKTFIYQAKNVAAAQLVAILRGTNQTGSKGPSTTTGTGARPATIQVSAPSQPDAIAIDPSRATSVDALRSVQFLVDSDSNRVLVQGTDSQFNKIRPLLSQLDVPSRTVLIEVAIAEITLETTAQFGVEWLSNNLKIGGNPIKVQTLNGLGIGSGGMSFALSAANLQVVINALSANNRIQLLSTPRIVAKSGGTARIEVGTDVPIISSQRALPLNTGSTNGNTDVLQQVEYRKTGVILTVKPVIHGNDRVELELEQELSEAAANSNTAINSPIIINRRVVTQLSVADSMTAVVGGLYSDSNTRGDQGVPGLKDLPVIGSAFRTDTRSGKKTELLIFLRPYIINNSRDMSDLADALKQRLDKFGPQPKVAIDRILGLNNY